MATSFKRTYPRTVPFRATDAAAGQCWPTPPLETLRHSQASLPKSLVEVTAPFPGSWCTPGFVCTLWASLVGMKFNPEHDFAPPSILLGFPGGSDGRICLQCGIPGFDLVMATHSSILAWKIPLTLEGYSPWGHKESDTIEQLHLSPSCCGFTFALGCGVSFFGGIQHSSVDRCSEASCDFGVLTGEPTSLNSAILVVYTIKINGFVAQ